MRTPVWTKAKQSIGGARGVQGDGSAIPILRPGTQAIRFSVEIKPPSVNSLYQIIYSQRRVITSPEYALFKSKFKQAIPVFEIEKGVKVGINLAVHADWYHKNGNMIHRDVQNLEKAIIDCIFERVSADDCQVWWKYTRKIQAERERIDIRLFAIGR